MTVFELQVSEEMASRIEEAAQQRGVSVDEFLRVSVEEKLRKGGRVADVGCGVGASTILMAKAFPNSQFWGFDYHQGSIDLARRQSTKSWELRAALSLSRLWQRQGKREAAVGLLGGVLGWFTEGLDTADLREARFFLDELSSPGDNARVQDLVP